MLQTSKAACALHVMLALSSLGACANELEPLPPVDDQSAELAGARDLSRGKRRTLVDNVVAAENQLFTSSGRLFVSGDEGVFEVEKQGTRYSARKLSTSVTCQFGGLTDYAGTLYANCYDGTDSKLLGAKLTEAPQLQPIRALPGVGLANGLTHDDKGNLYVASTFDGTILRLQLDPTDPLKVSAQDTYLPNAGLFSNGLKFHAGKLYWTAFTTVKAVDIGPDGKPGPQKELGGAFTFFDDLYVDDSGILLDDFLGGKVLAFDSKIQFLNATPNSTFNGPSSVQPAQGRLGLSNNAVIVTERGANRVSVFE
jgi:hypothetical protein